MRIDEVRALAFGPFEDRTLELAPGMTVVHGPNESGKSTWHAALYAGLCGMRRGPGMRKQDREFRNRRRPWDLDRWEVAVVVALDDGRRIELRHDLDGKVDSCAVDLVTSADLSGDIIYDGAPDGSRFLGLDRDTFLTTVCIRQADILGILDSADALQEQLQRAAATGGKDATAEQAIGAIEEYYRTNVGLARRNSTKPLQAAIDDVAAARKAHEEAKEAHAAYLELVRQRDRALDYARNAEKEQADLEAAARAGELQTLEGRLARAQELAAKVPDEEPQEPPRDRELEDRVEEAVGRFRRRPPIPAPLEGATAKELEAELAELPDIPTGDTEPADEVLTAGQAWHDASQALHFHEEDRPDDAPSVDESSADAAALRALADDLTVSVPEIDPELERRVEELRQPASSSSLSRMPWTVAAGLLGLAGVVVLAAGSAAAGVGLLVVAAVVAVLAMRSPQAPTPAPDLPQLEARLAVQQETRNQAERRRQAAAARCDELGLPTAPDELRRKARQAEDVAGAAERFRAWEEKQGRLRLAADEAHRHALSVMSAHRVQIPDPPPPVAELLDRYRAECRARAQQLAVAQRRSALEEQLRLRQEAEASRTAGLQEREAAERGIDELCDQLGIAVDDRDAAAGALEEWIEEQEADRSRYQELRLAWNEYRQLLDSRTLEELEAEVDELRQALPNGADAGEVKVPSPDEVDGARRHARELRADANGLVGEVRERERTLPDVAEAEERLALAQSELERVKRLADTLEHTKEFLEEARDRVNRDIAPVLGSSVTPRLGEVTSGRYTEALVDPSSLSIKVRTSTGRLREAQLLSHGATEQIYLLLRLAMAEHLVTEPETAPLILDDVLVQTDPQRSRRFLDLLHELSGERQVVLFSQEEDVLAWAREELDGEVDRLVELDSDAVAP